jgi:hypothetical protein
VRERGTFYLRWIFLESLTIKELYDKIMERYEDKPEKGEIYSVYRLWDRYKNPITTDEQVASFEEDEELEIIFENPSSKDRGSYSAWWYKKYRGETIKV